MERKSSITMAGLSKLVAENNNIIEMFDNGINNTNAGREKAVRTVLDIIIDTILTEVENDNRISISGFGRFEKRYRKARDQYNPITKRDEHIKAKNVLAFQSAHEFAVG